jgi:Trk K+ transport system NAD-binding subunit
MDQLSSDANLRQHCALLNGGRAHLTFVEAMSDFPADRAGGAPHPACELLEHLRIVKALSGEHGRILKAIGAHEIIHPEKDAATRLAHRSIAEITAPSQFVGKSLRELALRNRLAVQLTGIQRAGELKIVPRAEDVVEAGDLMMLHGADRDLDRIREIAK